MESVFPSEDKRHSVICTWENLSVEAEDNNLYMTLLVWSQPIHITHKNKTRICTKAYLHQELEKLQESNSRKVDLDDDAEDCDEHLSSDQKNLSVSRASHLQECLLTHTDQHEELASGPIEDLIAHREHRCCISGSALRAAIDNGSNALPADSTSSLTEDINYRHKNVEEIL